MSLVQSIFGEVKTSQKKSKKLNNNEALATLFDKKSTEVEEDKERDEEEEEASTNSESSSSSSSSSSDSSSSSSSKSEKDADNNKSDDEPASPTDRNLETSSSNITTRKKKDPASSANDDESSDLSDSREQRKIENKEQTVNANQAAEEHDNDDDDDEGLRTIFVGNLPLSTTRKSLTKLFQEKVGRVQSARLRSVAVTGIKVPQNYAGDQNLVKKVCTNTKQLDIDAKSSLQGYVVFVESKSVAKAIVEMNNQPLADDDPKATRAVRRIRVDTATPTLDPKRSVFVGNLPYAADESTLQDHFVQRCGFQDAPSSVRGVRIIRDKDTFQCKGFGYVLFEDSTMVATALQKMNDSIYMKRPLRVKVCGKSIKGRRGQQNPNSNQRKRQPYESPTTTNNKKHRHGGGENEQPRPAATGAMRRVAGKKKNKRVRGEKKKSGKPGLKPGVSKRAASDAKAEKRVKKLQKRVSKGMGKTRKH